MSRIVLLTALFLPLFDGKAALRLHGVNDVALRLQIIHGSIHGTKSYDLAGNAESEVISVQDGESIIILACKKGAIVASAIFEVHTALIASHEIILAPCCSSGIIVDQREFGQVERAFDRSLERAVTTSESREVL